MRKKKLQSSYHLQMPSSIKFPVFTETNLGTRIAISTPPDITTVDLKRSVDAIDRPPNAIKQMLMPSTDTRSHRKNLENSVLVAGTFLLSAIFLWIPHPPSLVSEMLSYMRYLVLQSVSKSCCFYVMGKPGREHYLCFPNLGEVKVHALMVKRKSCFYHLPESLLIKNAFQGSKGSWFLRMSATQVQHIHSQLAPTTDISNAMVGRKDRISQSISGNNSVGSSGIISVTGILSRYFSESDERNIFNCQAESIRNPNELAEQSVDSQMQKLVEIQCTNNIGCTTGVEFSMKQNKHNKNTSENNMVHTLIDPYIEKSKCNIVSKISKKRNKTELSDKERSVASYDVNDDSGAHQDNQDSLLSSLSGRDAASDAITVDSGAHHHHRDSEVEKFHCNIATEISKKDSKTGMSTSAGEKRF
ncbi:uncharacterized protein LOC131255196 [Magnolia sinica]|uniref:uncharacterized protein LOC131255196 n=1 Tax=Magnolia sinica TaxID=86752 RepID=UPI00265AEB92|nr:uncharacterized protein LOC131255196 [Magnolia sinica]